MSDQNAPGMDVELNHLLGELREGGCCAGCDALGRKAADEIEAALRSNVGLKR